MTTTYDPFHPKYLDGADLREEMDRVFDLCHGCRLCFKFCPSFPTLFAAIAPVSGGLTPKEFGVTTSPLSVSVPQAATLVSTAPAVIWASCVPILNTCPTCRFKGTLHCLAFQS